MKDVSAVDCFYLLPSTCYLPHHQKSGCVSVVCACTVARNRPRGYEFESGSWKRQRPEYFLSSCLPPGASLPSVQVMSPLKSTHDA